MIITQKVKAIISIATLVVVAGLLATCAIQCSTNKKLRAKYDISTANEKSLLDRLEKNGETIIEYQATIDMLRYTKDSTIQNLLEQQKKLKIKNKELQTMASLASQFHTKDTVRLHDTIFKDPDFAIDTCLADEWKKTCLGLKYPSDITIDASMKSQKDVFVVAKKEPINPPKKTWIGRLFQRKHMVTRVTIHEENPYIESQENVYISILDRRGNKKKE